MTTYYRYPNSTKSWQILLPEDYCKSPYKKTDNFSDIAIVLVLVDEMSGLTISSIIS